MMISSPTLPAEGEQDDEDSCLLFLPSRQGEIKRKPTRLPTCVSTRIKLAESVAVCCCCCLNGRPFWLLDSVRPMQRFSAFFFHLFFPLRFSGNVFESDDCHRERKKKKKRAERCLSRTSRIPSFWLTLGEDTRLLLSRPRRFHDTTGAPQNQVEELGGGSRVPN